MYTTIFISTISLAVLVGVIALLWRRRLMRKIQPAKSGDWRSKLPSDEAFQATTQINEYCAYLEKQTYANDAGRLDDADLFELLDEMIHRLPAEEHANFLEEITLRIEQDYDIATIDRVWQRFLVDNGELAEGAAQYVNRIMTNPSEHAFDDLLHHLKDTGSGKLNQVVCNWMTMNLRGPEPYAFERLLGFGGMGLVWRVRQTTDARQLVALKMMRPGLLEQLEESSRIDLLNRFQREAEAPRVVQDSHIITILRPCTKVDGPINQFYVMKLLSGKTLDDHDTCAGSFWNLPKRRIRRLQGLRYLVHVTQGLEAAHDRKIVHRDIKPANILISNNETIGAVISDFGLAKFAQREDIDDQGTEAQGYSRQANVGTKGYMAPEQELQASRATAKSDIYSLGACLYKVLTGSIPAASPDFNQIGSLDLRAITEKCLQRSATQRYENCRQLRDDLQAYLNGNPVSARPVGRFVRIAYMAVRNGTMLGVSALVMLLLIVALSRRESRPIGKPEEVLSKPVASQKPSAETQYDRDITIAELQLSQGEYGAAIRSIYRSARALALDSKLDVEALPLEANLLLQQAASYEIQHQASGGLALSADGSFLGVGNRDGLQIYRLGSRGFERNSPIRVLSYGEQIQDWAFSPYSALLAVTYQDHVLIWNCEKDSKISEFYFAQPTAQPPNQEYDFFESRYAELTNTRLKAISIAWAPDATRVWLAHSSGVECWDISTGKRLNSFPFDSGQAAESGGPREIRYIRSLELAATQDGDRLVALDSVAGKCELTIRETQSGTVLAARQLDDFATDLHIADDGDLLLAFNTTGEQKEVRVLDGNSLENLTTAELPSDQSIDLESQLIGGFAEKRGEFRVSTRDGRQVAVFKTEPNSIRSFAARPAAGIFCFSADNRIYCFFDNEIESSVARELRKTGSPTVSLRFSEDGRFLIAVNKMDDGQWEVLRWNTLSGESQKLFEGAKGEKWLAWNDQQGVVSARTVDETTVDLKGRETFVPGVTVIHEGPKKVHLQIGNETVGEYLLHHLDRVAISQDGRYLAFQSKANRVCLISIEDLSLQEIEASEQLRQIREMLFTADSRHLLLGGDQYVTTLPTSAPSGPSAEFWIGHGTFSVQFWALRESLFLQQGIERGGYGERSSVTYHSGAQFNIPDLRRDSKLTAAALHSDRSLIVGHENGALEILNAFTGANLLRLDAHATNTDEGGNAITSNAITSIATCANGFASASADGRVLYWPIAKGKFPNDPELGPLR